MDDLRRCRWACDQLLIAYHDTEYGRILTDDNLLFEKLSLEVFQAGLSWRTVLAKRDYFRNAFLKFNIDAVAALTDPYLESLLLDEHIIRNKRKIFAIRHNALAAQKIIAEQGSFFKYIYSFNNPQKLCNALKGWGFDFIGNTMVGAFMQSIGILEAHEPGCFLFWPTLPSEV